METKPIVGRIWIFGDNIDTDLIYPLTYFFFREDGITNKDEIRKHAMVGLDPEFVNKVQPGDIVVAGANFGCGSHREQAVTSLKYAGVGLIIAKSFARIYYRNAINLGLPVAEWATDDLSGLAQGDTFQVDLPNGVARNVTRGIELALKPLSPLLLNILTAGGLVSHVRARGIDHWQDAA